MAEDERQQSQFSAPNPSEGTSQAEKPESEGTPQVEEPEPEPSTTTQKLTIKRVIALTVTVALCCILIYLGRSITLYLALSAWGSLRLVNFLVNLTPTILSILFAFIVDKDLELHIRRIWRVSIILCGLGWSGLLWHQQTLTDKQSDQQIRGAVQQAVTNANKHTDEQFKAANQHADAKFGEVEKDVKGVSDQTVALSQALVKDTGDIDTNVGKVGKPERPKLIFSLWRDD